MRLLERGQGQGRPGNESWYGDLILDERVVGAAAKIVTTVVVVVVVMMMMMMLILPGTLPAALGGAETRLFREIYCMYVCVRSSPGQCR